MTQDYRENDKIILEEIRNLQKDISRIDINLALNTQETARLAKYQELMNGRVAAHETRMQVVEGAQAITSTAVASIQQNKNHWTDWLVKGVVGVGLALLYYLLTHGGGFPNFLN
jgi:hypothetical protein